VEKESRSIKRGNIQQYIAGWGSFIILILRISRAKGLLGRKKAGWEGKPFWRGKANEEIQTKARVMSSATLAGDR